MRFHKDKLFSDEIIFVIRLNYDEFNLSTYKYVSWDDFNQLNFFGMIPLVSAKPPPERYNVDMDEIIFNNLIFLTFSVKEQNKRVDYFIYPRGDVFYSLVFYDRSAEEITKIMNSVNFIKSSYIDVDLLGSQIMNHNIGLGKILLPVNWTHNRLNTSSEISYSDESDSFSLIIDKNNTEDVLTYMKSRCDVYPEEFKKGLKYTSFEDREYLKSNFGCEHANAFKILVSESKSLSCSFSKASDDIYYSYAYLCEYGLFVKAQYSNPLYVEYFNSILEST